MTARPQTLVPVHGSVGGPQHGVAERQLPHVSQHEPGLTVPRHIYTATRVSPGAFAVWLTDNAYAPSFNMRDLLIIDPARSPQDGDIVLVRYADQVTALRRFYADNPPLLIHPSNFRDVLRLTPSDAMHLLGTVVELVRGLPSL